MLILVTILETKGIFKKKTLKCGPISTGSQNLLEITSLPVEKVSKQALKPRVSCGLIIKQAVELSCISGLKESTFVFQVADGDYFFINVQNNKDLSRTSCAPILLGVQNLDHSYHKWRQAAISMGGTRASSRCGLYNHRGQIEHL
ncbi:hypothetical protein AVEN_28139-1 [Araneus ventricosus]|uniref:Uncharacterized protein n=1 Tax=Araneus ventricosus TaxID=182803 RepID=A0A4Y2GDQ1_ARAVE|nr:hypothetical protein AVEN_28139-1 [Araneus ventricosus]